MRTFPAGPSVLAMKQTLDLRRHSGAPALAVTTLFGHARRRVQVDKCCPETKRLDDNGEVDSERGVPRSAILCDPRRCIHLDHSMFDRSDVEFSTVQFPRGCAKARVPILRRRVSPNITRGALLILPPSIRAEPSAARAGEQGGNSDVAD